MYQANFSQRATEYDEHANVQKKCSKMLIDLIAKNLDCLQVENNSPIDIRHIDVGCGTGRVLLDFVDAIVNHKSVNKQLSSYQATGIDSSNGMLDVCKSRFLDIKSNINSTLKLHYDFVLSSADSYSEYKKFNVVTSNYVLQWLNNRADFLVKLLCELKEHSIIGVSYPITGTFYELTKINEMLKEDERIPIIHFSDKENADDLLGKVNACNVNENSKVRQLYSEELVHTEWFDNPLDALRSIKNIGASLKVTTNDNNDDSNSNNGNKDDGKLTYSAHSLRRFAKLYSEHFGVKGNDNGKVRIPLTYRTLFLVYAK